MKPALLTPEVLPYASVEIVHVDHTVTVLRAPAAIVCAYCPTFDPTVAPAPGTSHGICPACIATFEKGGRS
jgi:hypothetical protein